MKKQRPTKTLDLLEKAKALIEDPEHWCQHAMATDVNGNMVYPDCPSACRFCAIGALFVSLSPLNSKRSELYSRAARILKSVTDDGGLITLNDSEDHAAVMAMYDRAIAYSRRKKATA